MTSNQTNTVLPPNATAAILKLIKISQDLVDLTERETQTLVQHDLVSFSILQDEKEKLMRDYVGTSEQFRARLEDFRKVDQNLLTQLEQLQNTIGEKSKNNNALMKQIQHNRVNGTQNTLITTQELAQQKPLRFDPNTPQTEGV